MWERASNGREEKEDDKEKKNKRERGKENKNDIFLPWNGFSKIEPLVVRIRILNWEIQKKKRGKKEREKYVWNHEVKELFGKENKRKRLEEREIEGGEKRGNELFGGEYKDFTFWKKEKKFVKKAENSEN